MAQSMIRYVPLPHQPSTSERYIVQPTMTGVLDQYGIKRWALSFTTQQSLTLQHHSGSVFRGAFGHSLLNICCFCADKQHHSSHCVFKNLFAPESSAAQFKNLPPAILITPLPWGQRQIGCEQTFTIYLTAFKPAFAYMELVFSAMKLAAESGFGNSRARCELTDITPLAPLRFLTEATTSNHCYTIDIDITTPVFIKHKALGATSSTVIKARDFTAELLIAAVIRRLKLLASAHGLTLPFANRITLTELKEQVHVTHQLTDVSFQRTSSQQKKRIPQTGLIGHITVSTNSLDVVNALTATQWCHLGGKAALGLGAYTCQIKNQQSIR